MCVSDMWWDILWCAIWNPQDFILFLLHDGCDLSANVGDAASLDNTCNTEEEGGIYMGSVKPEVLSK